jgi:hypothetical protein
MVPDLSYLAYPDDPNLGTTCSSMTGTVPVSARILSDVYMGAYIDRWLARTAGVEVKDFIHMSYEDKNAALDFIYNTVMGGDGSVRRTLLQARAYTLEVARETLSVMCPKGKAAAIVTYGPGDKLGALNLFAACSLSALELKPLVDSEEYDIFQIALPILEAMLKSGLLPTKAESYFHQGDFIFRSLEVFSIMMGCGGPGWLKSDAHGGIFGQRCWIVDDALLDVQILLRLVLQIVRLMMIDIVRQS